jgi:acetyl-CoA C-acetyltransferase
LDALDLMAESLKDLVEKYRLQGQQLGEVALGTVFYPPSTWNFAREAVLRTELNPHTPAEFVQRACATSLDAAIVVGRKIADGHIDVGVAGGSESMSNVTIFLRKELAKRVVRSFQAKNLTDRVTAWKGLHLSDLKPGAPAAVESMTGKSMGEHCEMMAKEWKITRQEQDQLALDSHRNAISAYEKGFYKDLIAPLNGVERDTIPRPDTSMEKLDKLKTAFDTSPEGTLTAGNSSPFTDGAATVLLSSEEWAKAHGIPILAYLTEYETAAVDITKEGLLMAPAYAMPRMLARAQRKLQDFDYYEIHEAFAAQVLCTLKAWESPEFCRRKLKLETPLGSIDRKKMNVVGGSVALGHPFGATGARMIATMAKLLSDKGSGRGLLSICTGGGMGTVAMVER